MNFQDYLRKIGACSGARIWNKDRDLQKCWQDCERGDWMLWLMKKANLCDLRTLTLAKARCAELAKPYMKDERVLAALQAAFDFTNRLIDMEQLAAASASAAAVYDAYAAAYDADADAYTVAAAAAAYAAAAAADADAAAAAAAAAADAAAYAAYAADAAARTKILKQCADICREVLVNPFIEGVD